MESNNRKWSKTSPLRTENCNKTKSRNNLITFKIFIKTSYILEGRGGSMDCYFQASKKDLSRELLQIKHTWLMT